MEFPLFELILMLGFEILVSCTSYGLEFRTSVVHVFTQNAGVLGSKTPLWRARSNFSKSRIPLRSTRSNFPKIEIPPQFCPGGWGYFRYESGQVMMFCTGIFYWGIENLNSDGLFLLSAALFIANIRHCEAHFPRKAAGT